MYELCCVSDINECDEQTPCQGLANCENTVGSYRCSCPAGYRINRLTNNCVGKFSNVWAM